MSFARQKSFPADNPKHPLLLGGKINNSAKHTQSLNASLGVFVGKLTDNRLEMEELQKKHRQELRDLQSRITQRKKSATKKTRKGVNDECAVLERQLKENHETELSNLAGKSANVGADHKEVESDDTNQPQQESAKRLDESVVSLTLSNESMNGEAAKKPSRQKARLARRAAEKDAAAAQAATEAEDLPNLRAKEREGMQGHYTSKGLEEQEIRSDGHCLYAAVADQLVDAGIGLQPRVRIPGLDSDGLIDKPSYKTTRRVTASYIAANPDDFAPFLEESLDDYVRTILETGEWGGHLELMALAKAYDVKIHVLQGTGQVDTIESGPQSEKDLWLAYYRHSFGLGEHYNSLRKSR